MTNLSSSKKNKKFITPESSLIIIPTIVGIIILSILMAFVFRPLMNRLSREEVQIALLEEKISYLPIYKKYINELSIMRINAQKQQKRLIEIVSDPNELETILLEINRVAINNNIEIISLSPQATENYQKKGNTKNNNNINSNKDPLLIPSIQKQIFKIKLTGDFNSLVGFLKELELLQTIVISDNIEIKSLSKKSESKLMKLEMRLDMTFYANI